MNNAFLIESCKVISAIAPIDTNGATSASAWIAMKKGRRLMFIIQGGAWAGGTPAVTLTQASDSAGTGVKALAFTRYFTIGPTPADLAAEVAVVASTYNLPAAAATCQVIEVHAQDLDIANSFCFVKLNIASPGANADLISAVALLYDLAYAGRPASLPSALS